MDRILLVNPQWQGRVSKKGKRFNRVWPPLSLMVCASILRNRGCDVRIIDGRVLSDWRAELHRAGDTFDAIVLTSSPTDRWQCPNLEVDDFIEIARSLPSDKLIVVGAHGSVYPKQMLEKSGARAVIQGEPEEILSRLLSEEDWSRIPKVAFKKNGEIFFTGEGAPPDIGQFPAPAFDLIDLKKYRYELLGNRFMLFEGSRGCAYQCSFCLQAMYGSGVRYRPVDQLLNEVSEAVNRFGVRTGYFIDLEFTLKRDRIIRFCDELIQRHLPFAWCCQTRADAVDRELLNRMRQAGCRLIHFGVESGAPHILRSTNKKIDLAEIKKGIHLTQKAGIETACFFMFGFPDETPADMDQTISFAKMLNPTYASFHAVTPYPSTPLYNSYSKSVSTRDVSVDPMSFPLHCSDHDPALLDAKIKAAFKRFYLRPGYVWSQLLRRDIRSWVSQIRLLMAFAR